MEYKYKCPGARPDGASVLRMGELDAGTITKLSFKILQNLGKSLNTFQYLLTPF